MTNKTNSATRDNIVDCAVNIVLSEGANALTFSNIADRAGVSRSGINTYFRFKSDLESEVSERIFSIISKDMDFSDYDNFTSRWSYLTSKDRKFANAVSMLLRKGNMADFINKIESGAEKDLLKTTYLCVGYLAVNGLLDGHV